ncbi:DNA-binding transcriptional LysR family regulator [Oleiagrimonas soli]|uniref:DNA-binding transcriptional LysR family regulator n=1 Tax=Oleiagrimonas soli TaxID=1543381 RepID=A0A841KD03_9GAMM|nr:DNA-binding transcriptional LysR family regulator [Oleiagrimonas soli]
MTHSAVSRQIRALESQLGVPLFRRVGRGLRLTPAGLRLREAVSASFDRLRDACAELYADRNEDAAFVLGCPGSVLARWMIPRLDRLRGDLPDLPVHLSAQDTGGREGLERLDAALLIDAPPWPAGWRIMELAPERIGPVVSPRYAGWPTLRDRPEQALLHEPVLHTTSRPQAWRDWAEAAGLDAAPPQTGQAFAHLYQLIEAAAAGLGVAIAPQPLVAEELRDSRLLAPWGFRPTHAAWTLVSAQRGHDPRFATLGAWLGQALDGG